MAIKTIVWLKNDLRLSDNLALQAALSTGQVVVAYVHEPQTTATEARHWWLYHSLQNLERSLKKEGIPLVCLTGYAHEALPQFAKEQKATTVFWHRSYSPQNIQNEELLTKALQQENIKSQTFVGNLLVEPWDIQNKQGLPFKVFTPMFKHLLSEITIKKPSPFKGNGQNYFNIESKFTITLNSLKLIDPNKTWHKSFEPHWQVGEETAEKKLKDFLQSHITKYQDLRDIPSSNGTSTLSPHLHFGEISVRDIWAQIERFEKEYDLEDNRHIQCFKSELVWREFAYQQFHYYKNLENQPINAKFSNFPWKINNKHLTAWQQGLTGIPMVDAGMRELWHTGTMHNRVRMIVASFLTKNLLIPWQEGAKWFMDTLVDADEAANSANWQWVAGCGLDAAPYFRIFNPVSQGQKFDSEGLYVKKWLPELKNLDKKYIHNPWEAGDFELKLANITLGEDYPTPIINLKASRERALQAYNKIK